MLKYDARPVVVDDRTLTVLLDRLVAAIFRVSRRADPVIGWRITVGRFTFRGIGGVMFTLPLGFKAGLAIDPRDAGGNVTTVDGVPVWSTSDDTLGALSAAADGLTAEYTPAGPLGSVQLQVKADVRKGDEVVEKIGVLDVTIEAGEAVTLGIGATLIPLA